MKRRIGILLLICSSLCVFVSCKKDTPPVNNITDITKNHGVFIVNEGNYMWSNASVTYNNFIDGKYYEDIFEEANSRPLGDVAQSITVINGKGYLVVNNSNKIEIVDLNTFSSLGVISGLTSPRYMLPVTSTKAYVTDLYSNSISIVDLNSNTKTGSIPCKGSTEEMLMIGDNVIVSNTRTDKIYIISTISDAITDSIQVGFASNSLALDKNGKLWVYCSGDVNNSTHASLHRVDVDSHLVEQSFPITTALDIWDKMRINVSGDTLYYIDNGIYQMPISAATLPASPLIPQGSSLFHGLGINPIDNHIFVADAVDYVQKGKVNYYTSSGTYLGTINTGIIPSAFYFY